MNTRKLFFLLLLPLLVFSCDDEKWPDDVVFSRDFEGDMKTIVEGIRTYTDQYDTTFLLVPNNSVRLVTSTGEIQSDPDLDFLNAIDGIGCDYIFYGYYGLDEATPYHYNGNIIGFLEKIAMYYKPIMVTDYCTTSANIDDAYTQCHNEGYLSYAAPGFDLDQLAGYPSEPFDLNTDDIDSISKVMNFVNIQSPEGLGTKTEFLSALSGTNYDLVITDLFFNGEGFTQSELAEMKLKKNGHQRLVLACMNIGLAEADRYYFEESWSSTPPDWFYGENEEGDGSYWLNYWETDWQDLLFGNDDSYIKQILDAGFDGVYLNGADAYEYFEEIETEAWEGK